MTADWNDIDAALDYAISQAEVAFVDWNPAASESRTVTLRSAHDEHGVLVITQPLPPPPKTISGDPPPVEMTLRCTIGRFGNPATEQRFLRALTARLTALRGVDYRPL